MTILWTDKHKPDSLENMVGQKKAIQTTLQWLENWKKGSALMYSGPPGVGKNLLIEIISKQKNLILHQVNASDKRSAKDIDEMIHGSKTGTLFYSGKIILFDEVDGISGRERGAAGAIANIIKESEFPVILIANDPYLPKLKTLRKYTTHIKFTKIPSPSIVKRLRDICKEEGISADDYILKNLARWSGGDLRSAIIDLQLLSMGKQELIEKDMESLGFRERSNKVFDILPTILKSKNLNATRKVIIEADTDSDEILWWVENNIPLDYKKPEEIAKAYDTLSRADLFRALVMKQQNWRFKAYMADMIASISLNRTSEHTGWAMYRPPDRFMQLARTKKARREMDIFCSRIGEILHTSKRRVKLDYLPYFNIIAKKDKVFAQELKVLKEAE